MLLLLIAATSLEIQPTINFLTTKNPAPGLRIEVLIGGIGTAATVYALTKKLANERPDLVVQAGIAGSLAAYLPGETVQIQADRFGDLGVWEADQFRTVFDLGLSDPDAHPFVAGALPNPHDEYLQLLDLRIVNGVTVNEISTDEKMIRQLQQLPDVTVESMEGAALHFVCLQEGVPFLQLRALSNPVGERDKRKWQIAEAVASLNEQLIRLINLLAERT